MTIESDPHPCNKKCLKMNDLEDLRKILRLKLAKHAFLGVKLQFLEKKPFRAQKETLLEGKI